MSARETPRVTVLMAVRNGARHLPHTLDSILGQSFGDFEFLIIDDASEDATPDLLAEAAARDPRIRVLRNEANLGLFPSLNRGLDAARGEIIVRSDADDISAPDRIARQVAFLDAHPEYLFVGCSYRSIDDAGALQRVKIVPCDHDGVRWLARFRQAVAHPSLCYRARTPDGAPLRYATAQPVAQDCEFVARISALGRGAVLRAPLIDYRTHAGNISSTRRQEQLRINVDVARRVHLRDAPAVAGRLDPLLDGYLLHRAMTPAQVRATMRAVADMLAADDLRHPAGRRWRRRQIAGILAEAVLRRGGGFQNPAVLLAFVTAGARHLGPLILRALEDRELLPRALDSRPDPEADA